MPLVEIIAGEKTNDATIAGALDYVQQIKKTPIVVNDSRGFFTSRVIGHFINEGLGDARRGRQPQSRWSGRPRSPASRSASCRSATSSTSS